MKRDAERFIQLLNGNAHMRKKFIEHFNKSSVKEIEKLAKEQGFELTFEELQREYRKHRKEYPLIDQELRNLVAGDIKCHTADGH